VEYLSRDDLLAHTPPKHYVKDWSGIIDPKDVLRTSNNPVWQQLSQKEPHEEHFHVFSAFPGEPTILDIGANCGQSIISIKLVNERARIKSFEPTAFSYAIADRVSRVFDGSEVFNFGLSDKKETLPIHTPVIDGLLITPLASLDPGMFAPGGTMHKFLHENVAGGAPVSIFREEVKLERGDDLALAPDVMKIDVEGAELKVLRGLRKTIAENRPMIMTEKSDAAEIAAYLKKLGYFACRYAGKAGGPHVFHHMAITPDTDTNIIPLNVFYIHEHQAPYYNSDLGMRFI
jgi:FkbM family methyltransferase